uniref:Uncharacterized protein n=1 Tax=Triticum urartu TaxID=4572 RepID=A0A8R7V5A6_TRIUA
MSCSLCSCFIRRSNRDFESRGERETAIISIHSSPSLVASGVRLLFFRPLVVRSAPPTALQIHWKDPLLEV